MPGTTSKLYPTCGGSDRCARRSLDQSAHRKLIPALRAKVPASTWTRRTRGGEAGQSRRLRAIKHRSLSLRLLRDWSSKNKNWQEHGHPHMLVKRVF